MTYRAILINPEAKTVEEIMTAATPDEIKSLIDADHIDSLTIAAFENRQIDKLWLDDEALARGQPIHAFMLPIYKGPLGGKGLILGHNDRGELADCRFPIVVLRRDIEWLGLILPEVTWDWNGPVASSIVTYSRVKQ